jgi:hypothetical protein
VKLPLLADLFDFERAAFSPDLRWAVEGRRVYDLRSARLAGELGSICLRHPGARVLGVDRERRRVLALLPTTTHGRAASPGIKLADATATANRAAAR